MSIQKKMLGSMGMIMSIFIFTILIINKNSNDLQKVAETSISSYGLTTEFANLENVTLRFKIEKRSLENYAIMFKDSRDQFEVVLELFNNMEGKNLLDSEFQDRWININKLWAHSEKNLNIIIEKLEEMSKHDVSSLFITRTFSEIIKDTSIFTKSDKYREDYTNVRAINSALDSISSTTDIFNKALSSTRDGLEKVVELKTSSNRIFTIITLLVAIIVSFGFSILFTNNISKKIKYIKDILKEVSKKNLAVKMDIKSKDEFRELGVYVNDLIHVLHDFIGSTGNSADNVTQTNIVLGKETSKSEISLNNIDDRVIDVKNKVSLLDQNIERSAQDIVKMDEEILNIVKYIQDQSVAVSSSSSAIEEMIASVNQIAKLTSLKQKSTKDLLSIVKRGGLSVENTLENIQHVNNEVIQIKELVEVIKSVADQTDILSMNAAIESAHAGEAGKGFSVVADEIRALSEYTAINVQDINKAINSISVRIDASLKASEESSTVFEQINIDVNDFSMAMTEISSSIEELAIGGSDVLNSTTKLSSLNDEVREGASRIKQQSGEIETEMSSVKDVSSDVNSFIIGISERTKSILASFKGINEVSLQSGERIADLNRRIDEFNLGD